MARWSDYDLSDWQDFTSAQIIKSMISNGFLTLRLWACLWHHIFLLLTMRRANGISFSLLALSEPRAQVRSLPTRETTGHRMNYRASRATVDLIHGYRWPLKVRPRSNLTLVHRRTRRMFFFDFSTWNSFSCTSQTELDARSEWLTMKWLREKGEKKPLEGNQRVSALIDIRCFKSNMFLFRSGDCRFHRKVTCSHLIWLRASRCFADISTSLPTEKCTWKNVSALQSRLNSSNEKTTKLAGGTLAVCVLYSSLNHSSTNEKRKRENATSIERQRDK